MNIQVYLLLALAIIFNALANIVVKWAMRGENDIFSHGYIEAFRAIASNYWAWAGIALFGLAFILYSLVLTKMNLSIAYPIMTSLGLVIISVVSIFAFQESFSLIQAGGIVLIIGGVWLVSLGL